MDKSELLELLEQNSEIEIEFIGRKTGNKYSTTVWFIHDLNHIYLLPVKGSQTNWYRNILRNPDARVSISGKSIETTIKPVSDLKPVKETIERFNNKYGINEIQKYYSILDAAAEIEI